MSTKKNAEARRQQKQFEKERRILQRMLPKAVKIAAAGSGWQAARGVLFREENGWFIQAYAVPWIMEAKTFAKLHCKPMALDPLFWQLVRREENVERPLSFRALGAYTCQTPALRETEIPENGDSAERIAKQLVDWANEQFRTLNGAQTVDALIEFIRTHPDQIKRQEHLTPLVTSMLLQGRDEEALAICKNAKIQAGGSFLNDPSGFIFFRNDEMITFTDLAIEWIVEKQIPRVIN